MCIKSVIAYLYNVGKVFEVLCAEAILFILDGC